MGSLLRLVSLPILSDEWGRLRIWYRKTWDPLLSFCEVSGTDKRRSSRIMSPAFYNSIWITWAALATIATVYWASRAITLFSNFQDHFKLMHNMLEHSSTSWDRYHDLEKVPIRLILLDMNTLFHDWAKVRTWMVWWGNTWAVLGSALLVVSLIIFPASCACVTLFVQVLSRCVRDQSLDTDQELVNSSTSLLYGYYSQCSRKCWKCVR
jgi:hypothetical protein